MINAQDTRRPNLILVPTEGVVCRIEDCWRLVSEKSSLCAGHIESGREHLWRMLPVLVPNRPKDLRTAKLHSRQKCGFVYAIAGGGFIKFGRARDVQGRLAGLQTSTPWPLSILGFIPETLYLERRIHKYLQWQRARGEWFKSSELTDELVALFVANDVEGVEKLLLAVRA